MSNGFPDRRLDMRPRLRTPFGQPCICGEERIDYRGEGLRSLYLCCCVTYLGDQIVAIGQVWLDGPMKAKIEPSAQQLLNALADAAPAPEGMTTALYRRRDADGVLLYVGITDRLPDRSRWHERHSAWAPFVTSRTTEWFASRRDAEAAEKAAIKAERPLFNRQHADPAAQAALAAYLLDGGRIRLINAGEPSEAQK